MLSFQQINKLLNNVNSLLFNQFQSIQNHQAVIIEFQSNLSTFLRNKENYLYVIEMLNDKNIKEIKDLENILLSKSQKSNQLLLDILYISILKNLNVNQKTLSSNNIEPIANQKINYLLGADGISILNKSKDETEILINYASGSWKAKDGDTILKEINNGISFLNNQDKIKQTFYLQENKEDKYKNIFNYIKNNDMTIEKKLNYIINELNILQKRYKKESQKLTNIKKIKNKVLPNIKKHIKISISDINFNNFEMLKLYVYIKEKIKNNKLDSFILENNKTGISILFNKENITNIYYPIFEKQISNIEDDYFLKQQQKRIDTKLNNLKKIFINIQLNKYKNNELFKTIYDFYNQDSDILINDKTFNSLMSKELENVSYYEDFIIEYNKLYNYLEHSLLSIETKNLFNMNYTSENKTQDINIILSNVLNLNDNINTNELFLIRQFISFYKNKTENKLTDIILNRLILKYTDIVNKIIPKEEINKFQIRNNKKINSFYTFYDIENNELKLNQNILKNIKTEISSIHIIDYLKEDSYYKQLKLSSLSKKQKKGNEIEEVLKNNIIDYYFSDFKENTSKEDLNKIVDSYVNVNYNGNLQIATSNIDNDIIIQKNFSNLINAYKNRINNFVNENNNKIKHLVIVVDYDNDGTLAKLIAEGLKKELQELFSEKDQHDNLIQIQFTNNYDKVRGITFKDVEDATLNYKKDKEHELIVLTADNGSSNIEEIEKLLNTKTMNGCKCEIKQVLINDHHKFENKNKDNIINYYIDNYKKVLLFNPEYIYKKNNIIESGEKNISGATAFYHALSYLIKDKDKKEYLEKITSISNVMDYVDIEHNEIANPKEIEQIMKMARDLNLYQKYTIYFNTLLKDMVIDNKDFLIDINDNEEQINILKNKLKKIINNKYNSQPIQALLITFVNNFFENEQHLLLELFDKNIIDKKEVIFQINEKLKNLGPEYLQYKFKKENNKKNYSLETKRLDELFENDFEQILTSFKNEYSNFNKKDLLNIEKIVLKDKDNKELIIFVDHSIPAIPRKLIMDLTRSEIKNSEGIILFGRIENNEFSGSARVSSIYKLPDFSLTNSKEKIILDFKGHDKAAGVSFPLDTLNKIKEISKSDFDLNITIDNNEKIQYIYMENILDMEKLINNSRILNNRKTGGLNIFYTCSLDEFKKQSITIENFGTFKIDSLGDYKNYIKNHKTYSILLDFHNGSRISINGSQLLQLIDDIEKNEKKYLNFKFFNDNYSLDNITSKINFDKTIIFKKSEKIIRPEIKEYMELIDTLKKEPIKTDFIHMKLENNSKLVNVNLNISTLMNSKKQKSSDIKYWDKMSNLLKNFGMFNNKLTEMKNVKKFILDLEKYYQRINKNYKEIDSDIKNFMITDVETNGFFGLIQNGHIILKGDYDKNGDWKLKNINILTSIIKKEYKGASITPAITKLTGITEDLVNNYSTFENNAFDIFLKNYPKKEETLMIAHNALFDYRALNLINHPKMKDYLQSINIFDTMPLSKNIGTTGHYQNMSSIYIKTELDEVYLGLIPEYHLPLRTKINDKNKYLELRTIDEKKIIINNGDISLKDKFDKPLHYQGKLIVKNSVDTRLSSVSQNILGYYLDISKENILKNFDINIQETLKERLLINIKKWIKENWIRKDTEINIPKINISKKLNQDYVLKIIDYDFISNNIDRTLFLTNKKRKVIGKNIERHLTLFQNIAKDLKADYAISLFDLIIDNKPIKNKTIEDGLKNLFLIKLNNISSNKNNINQKNINRNNKIKYFKELISNNSLYKSINELKEANNLNILLDIVINNKILNNFVKKYLLENRNTIQKMVFDIFDDNQNNKSYEINNEGYLYNENELLSMYYSNARQQKIFLELFIKNHKDISNYFNNKEISIENINDYLLDINEELNNFSSLSLDEKTLLLKGFIELDRDPNFSFDISELHNNFISPFSDIGIEGMLLPLIYENILNNKNKEEQKEIINNLINQSNVNKDAANLRKIMFNSAANQFTLINNINTSNILIKNDNNIIIQYKLNNKVIEKKYNIKNDIPNIFSKDISDKINTLYIKYLNDNSEITLKELKELLLTDTKADIAIKIELNKIEKEVNLKKQINTEMSLIKNINTLAFNIITFPKEELFYKLLKNMYKEYIKDNKLEDFNNLMDFYLEDNFKITKIQLLDGSNSYRFNKKSNALNNGVLLNRNKLIKLFKNIDTLEKMSFQRFFIFDGNNKDVNIAFNNLNDYNLHLLGIDKQLYNIYQDHLNQFIKDINNIEYDFLYTDINLYNKKEYKSMNKILTNLKNISNIINTNVKTPNFDENMKNIFGCTLLELLNKKSIDTKNNGINFIKKELQKFVQNNETLEDLSTTRKRQTPANINLL